MPFRPTVFRKDPYSFGFGHTLRRDRGSQGRRGGLRDGRQPDHRVGGHVRRDTPPDHLIKSAFDETNLKVLVEAQSNPERHGMGATLACAWVIGRRLYTASAGDSRIYLMRGGTIRQTSIDHTYAGGDSTRASSTRLRRITSPTCISSAGIWVRRRRSNRIFACAFWPVRRIGNAGKPGHAADPR